ncbi:FecR domain-containing protein [Sulfurospirillum diekertiae]|uniref:FecR domain-containing protein n=1 Tax=Sulfurospirillum diekertiae TaxID=1854492 RepID=A0A6G9VS71_9BACT|nr:FecR domain-containing protein [Sulfurospirillum diekertiae]QIR76008.1 FecR domain-containing protein [Sulfurospirillum diekertiae]QIR78651.1 FecR domain-containing protein [Sulfurospirillum diekertiae]
MSKCGRLGILMCLIISTPVWAAIGQVSLLKGEAIANRNQKIVSLTSGATFEEHDIITTRANSQIQLTFEDKTVITLGSESVLNIQEYLNDAEQPKAKFKFGQGTFKSITGQIGKKAPENFKLETSTATIGIRGTTVAGTAAAEGSQNTVELLACLDGEIVVSNNHGSVIISSGYFTLVSPNMPPPPPVVMTPQQIQQLYQGAINARPPLPEHEQNEAENTPPPPSPQQQIQPPSPTMPALAEQASQTNTSTNIAHAITNHVEEIFNNNGNNGNLTYPTFNPPLQAATHAAGIINLVGIATSTYTQDGMTRTSATDTLTLNLDTSDDSITTDSSILLDRGDVNYPVSLAKVKDSNTMTYKNKDEFSIKNFDSQAGWMQTENTYTNDYVSWGYWAMKINNDSKLLSSTNYWVAGKNVDADTANNYITTKIHETSATSYAYNGHVIGSVSDRVNNYSINPTNNNDVKLNFNFGAGSGSLLNTSYIQFQTNQATPQTWKIFPSGTIEGGSFNLQKEANVAINGTTNNASLSTIRGQFYGNEVQVVGGTFSATAGTNTATGVFKAVK